METQLFYDSLVSSFVLIEEFSIFVRQNKIMNNFGLHTGYHHFNGHHWDL